MLSDITDSDGVSVGTRTRTVTFLARPGTALAPRDAPGNSGDCGGFPPDRVELSALPTDSGACEGPTDCCGFPDCDVLNGRLLSQDPFPSDGRLPPDGTLPDAFPMDEFRGLPTGR